jgi:hypothetical protein
MTDEEKKAAWDAACVLGIGEGETIDAKTLRRTYAKYAHEWHPDFAQKRGVSPEKANEMMTKGNSSHSALRRAIDACGGSYTVTRYTSPTQSGATSPSGEGESSGSGRGTAGAGKRQRGSTSNVAGEHKASTRGQGSTTKSPGQGSREGGVAQTTTTNGTGQASSGDLDLGSLWTWLVFGVAIVVFIIWNESDPQAAFEFYAGSLFHPERIFIFLGIAYAPRFLPF